MGLTVRKEVKGDGNCFFRALSNQLSRFGVNMSHQKIRKTIVRHLNENPFTLVYVYIATFMSKQDSGEHLSQFIPLEWTDYINSMKMPGTWADEIVVRAAATVFDPPVYIVSSLEDENSDKQINARTAEGNRRAPMLLGHVAENHYWSLDLNTAKQPETFPGNGRKTVGEFDIPAAAATIVDGALRMAESSFQHRLSTDQSYELFSSDFQSLQSKRWLNDKIVNALHIVFQQEANLMNSNRVLSINSYLVPSYGKRGYDGVWRATMEVNVFEYELIAIPVHRKNHWIEVIVDIFEKCLNVIDSAGNTHDAVCDCIILWLCDEHRRKYGTLSNKDFWQKKYLVSKEKPQQIDSVNCGVWTCVNMRDYSLLGKLQRREMNGNRTTLACVSPSTLSHQFMRKRQ
ncbi:uncharacterized protein LOC134183454 isoform X3 [Corticium candelabrum]|uniref:uncharacterized protein LOC134183454 isoform X3 n=1 Tax=Corticium candelabrum TaxID=121492 RepID=UPI002E26117E|nr:uncharacterized protein LOC134183454 isoform X3 [Corticium candelabrum]